MEESIARNNEKIDFRVENCDVANISDAAVIRVCAGPIAVILPHNMVCEHSASYPAQIVSGTAPIGHVGTGILQCRSQMCKLEFRNRIGGGGGRMGV